jgi:hypothetical protein
MRDFVQANPWAVQLLRNPEAVAPEPRPATPAPTARKHRRSGHGHDGTMDSSVEPRHPSGDRDIHRATSPPPTPDTFQQAANTPPPPPTNSTTLAVNSPAPASPPPRVANPPAPRGTPGGRSRDATHTITTKSVEHQTSTHRRGHRRRRR